jgi:hypothetical protein
VNFYTNNDKIWEKLKLEQVGAPEP